MEVIVRPRQAGKTTQLVEWVREGSAVPFYPFFDRVIVTQSLNRGMWLRSHFGLEYNQVYHLEDWRRARIVADVDIAIDDGDDMLQHLVGHGRLVKVTFTEDA